MSGAEPERPDRRRVLGIALCVLGLVLLLVGVLGLLAGCAESDGDGAGGAVTAPPRPPGASDAVPPLPLPEPRPPADGDRPTPGLDAVDKARLAEAKRLGARWVVVLVSAQPGHDEEAVDGLKSLGGAVGTSPGPELLRATLPPDQVPRAAELPSVTALDVTEVVPPDTDQPYR